MSPIFWSWVLKAGGKPSTWLPPGRLVKLFIEAHRSRLLKADTFKTRVCTYILKLIIPHDNLTDYDENNTKIAAVLNKFMWKGAEFNLKHFPCKIVILLLKIINLNEDARSSNFKAAELLGTHHDDPWSTPAP